MVGRNAWLLIIGVALGALVTSAIRPHLVRAQTAADDALVAAPEHYKLELENDLVRVIRVRYGPHESSTPHTHAGMPTVFVALTDGGPIRQISGDGKVATGEPWKAGRVRFASQRPALTHRVENLGDQAFEELRIEVKPRRAGTAQRPDEASEDRAVRD